MVAVVMVGCLVLRLPDCWWSGELDAEMQQFVDNKQIANIPDYRDLTLCLRIEAAEKMEASCEKMIKW